MLAGTFTRMILVATCICSAAQAAVTAEQATMLKTKLTPVGAERAGNAAGTIPSWTGGSTTSAPGYVNGGPRPDPFSGDKPVLILTSTNFHKYAEKLPEGIKHLFEKCPAYKMNIYPSHRSAAAPSWVYDNVFRNATMARGALEGIAYGVDGAIGGIPFPIPANGFEAMWNHLLAFWGPARELHVSTYVVPDNGSIDKTASYREIADFPYYYRGATADSLGGYYFKTLHIQDGPPARAGEAYLNWQPLNTKRYHFAAWRLVPGEHRARNTPAISYDVPDPDADGYESLDEYYIFFGGLDHYNFKIIGKKEMYVPYNNNRVYTIPVEELLGRNYANPDALRYELHRVWVVEGTLANGKHDIVSRRRLYLDEDTWLAVYGDSWDERGALWKFEQATMYLMPDVPAVVIGSQFVYDFELGGYAYSFALDDGAYKVTPPHPAALFTPASLAARAIR